MNFLKKIDYIRLNFVSLFRLPLFTNQPKLVTTMSSLYLSHSIGLPSKLSHVIALLPRTGNPPHKHKARAVLESTTVRSEVQRPVLNRLMQVWCSYFHCLYYFLFTSVNCAHVLWARCYACAFAILQHLDSCPSQCECKAHATVWTGCLIL